MKQSLRIILHILTFAAIVFYAFHSREQLGVILSIPWFYAFMIILFNIIPLLFLAWLFKLYIKVFDVVLPFSEWFGLTVTNSMYNTILPIKSGTILRAIYLKKKYKFSYSKYISFTTGGYLLNLFTSSFIATTLAFIYYFTGKLQIINFLYLCLVLLVGVLTFALILSKINWYKIKNQSKLFRFIRKTSDGFYILRKQKVLIYKLVFIQSLFIIAMGLRLWFVFYVLDKEVDLFKLIMINSLVVFSMVFSFTPGNIGMREGIIGASSILLNITFKEALLGAVLDRILAIIMILVLGLIFSRILINRTPLIRPNITKL